MMPKLFLQAGLCSYFKHAPHICYYVLHNAYIISSDIS